MNKSTNKTLTAGCEDAAASREPRPQQLAEMGTESSNTVPSNCINTYNTKILRTGIDSLYLSYQGDLSEESSIRLTELKKLAQSDDPERVALAQIEINTHLFEVKDRGRNPFSFILKDNWYQLAIAKLGAKRVPLAYVQLFSELLTQQGSGFAVKELSKIVGSLGNLTEQPAISRIDLCVDFVTDYHLPEITDSDWVTRAQDINNHSSNRQYSGTTIGAGGNISARLYNKTLEMKKKPRLYLEDIHSDCGWNGQQQVWRLEFQFMREALRDLGVRYYSDLDDSLSGLWQYATTKWLRHTIPNDIDKTQSRWPVSDLWCVLQHADWQGDKQLSREPVEKGRIPSDRSLFINGISGFTSFMAREGIVDHHAALQSFFTKAKQFHDNREHITGLDFVGYISQKVALKMRDYGTSLNMPADSDLHPSDKAVSDAYRKARDGG